MSMVMEDEIKLWTAKRKSPLVMEILQGKTPHKESAPEKSQSEQGQHTLQTDTNNGLKIIPEPQKVSPSQNIHTIQKKPKKEIYAQANIKNFYKEALSLYSTPSNFAIILRDTQTSTDKTYADALHMYENKNYQEAAKLLNGLDDEKSAYLQAHCYLLSGRVQEATDIFRNMADNDFSSYHQDAKWYLTIALLAEYPTSKNELEKAIQSFEDDPKRRKSLDVIKSKIK